MSLNEKRHAHLPDMYLTENVCRSKSFAGLSRRTSSTDAPFFVSGVIPAQTTRTVPWTSLLNAIKNNKSSKSLKSPKPERIQTVFDSLYRGLKDCIHYTQKEISTSRCEFDNVSFSSAISQGKVYELEKQVKVNERYLKRLEFHLSKLEEIKERYDVQQKIRDGIRNMGYAYMLSPGKLKDSALQNVKMEFRECTEVMCTYESNLETLAGSLYFEINGIHGFARICSGDIFEVTVKHGDQKWKTRGKVMKNGEQLWENNATIFKALFNEPLCIKAAEVRGLGKNIVLGNKFCETLNLFCVHPQQMMINLNPSGSLKLNLLIRWNPMHDLKDGLETSLAFPCGNPYFFNSCHGQSKSETNISSAFPIETKQFPCDSICDSKKQSCNQINLEVSAEKSIAASPDDSLEVCDDLDKTILNSSLTRTDEYCALSCFMDCKDELISNENSTHSIHSSSSVIHKHAGNSNSGELNINDNVSLSSNPDSMHTSGTVSSFQSLIQVLKNLKLVLDQDTEAFPELEDLLLLLDDLEDVLCGKTASSSCSNISTSVESALECFDFLDTALECDEDDEELHNMTPMAIEDRTLCILDESDIFCEDNSLKMMHKCKFDLTPLNVSSLKSDIYLVLTDHLLYCTRLVSLLFPSGPFKCLAVNTLKKMKKQHKCLQELLVILKKSKFCICQLFEVYEIDILELWNDICKNGIYCLAEYLRIEMIKKLKYIAVLDTYMASIVSSRLLSDLLDCSLLVSSACVSIFQFKSYFSRHVKLDSVLLEFAADVLAAEDLKCENIDKAIHAVSILAKIVPSYITLFYVGALLISSDSDLRNVAKSYFRAVKSDSILREKVISVYLKMLQAESSTSRLVSCNALDILQAKECLEQLQYVAEKDDDVNVLEAASIVLEKFGLVQENNTA